MVAQSKDQRQTYKPGLGKLYLIKPSRCSSCAMNGIDDVFGVFAILIQNFSRFAKVSALTPMDQCNALMLVFQEKNRKSKRSGSFFGSSIISDKTFKIHFFFLNIFGSFKSRCPFQKYVHFNQYDHIVACTYRL